MSRDYNQFPDDENGNVLWQMHQDGDDLQEAHEIEFSIAFADEAQADRCALHLLKEEQKISLFQDEESDTLFVEIFCPLMSLMVHCKMRIPTSRTIYYSSS